MGLLILDDQSRRVQIAWVAFDTPQATALSFSTPAETVTTSETITIAVAFLPVAIADAITASETLALTIALPVSAAESTTVTEQATVSLALPTTVADVITTTEEVQVVTFFLGQRRVQVSWMAFDTPMAGNLGPTLDDTITPVETVTLTIHLQAVVQEAVTATEFISASLTMDVAVADLIVTSDAPIFNLLLPVSIDDVVITSELTTQTMALPIAPTDSVTVSDDVSLSGLESGGFVTIGRDEFITPTDQVSVQIFLWPVVGDLITTDDTPALLLGQHVSPFLVVDTISVAEASLVIIRRRGAGSQQFNLLKVG